MRITKREREWAFEGKRLLMRASACMNGWAVDLAVRRGGAWTAIAASDRTTAAPTARTLTSAAALNDPGRPQAFGLKPVKSEKTKTGAALTLEGGRGPLQITQTITLFDAEQRAHVHTAIRVTGRARVSSLTSAFLFLPDGELLSQYDKPDFIWIPHLRKSKHHTIADQIFRSPVLVIQSRGMALSLVPDLDVLARSRPLPCCMNLQLEPGGVNAPRLQYGFRTYKLDGHVFFRHNPDSAVWLSGTELEYAFDLLLDGNAPHQAAHRRAVAFLWERYGRALAQKVEPQAVAFDTYADYAREYAFERSGIYHEFEVDGRRVAGTFTYTTTANRKPAIMDRFVLDASLAGRHLIPFFHGLGTDKIMTNPAVSDIFEVLQHNLPPAMPPTIWNQAWHCNLRTAYGLRAHAERQNDEQSSTRAGLMKELALAAPVERGAWPSVCYAPGGRVFWHEGTKAFVTDHDYHAPDNAWTGVWMMHWFHDIERDDRLLERARGFGGLLLDLQTDDGAIPPWFRFRGNRTVVRSTLRHSAQTAAPGMFLAMLARETGDGHYLDAARRAADFIIERIMPDNIWWDYETFFSCSKKDVGMRDAGAGLHCMNNLCVFWAAELFSNLYELTGEGKYLEAGLRAIDLLCLWQQVWDAPYVSINTFGGFGVMNTDAEWNDARQSMFAETLASYFLHTGDRAYFERAVAALRASFTLMLAPENESVAPANMRGIRPGHYGAVYENYAHLGFDRRVPGYVMFDWGSGGALAAAARMRLRFGDVFIHAPSKNVFGIDFCTAENMKIEKDSISFILTTGGGESGRALNIKSAGLPKGRFKLIINKKVCDTYTKKKLESGVSVQINDTF